MPRRSFSATMLIDNRINTDYAPRAIERAVKAHRPTLHQRPVFCLDESGLWGKSLFSAFRLPRLKKKKFRVYMSPPHFFLFGGWPTGVATREGRRAAEFHPRQSCIRKGSRASQSGMTPSPGPSGTRKAPSEN